MPDRKLIVLIDDDDATRELVRIVLEEKDFTVETFQDFDSALDFLEKNTPELIISDLIGHDDYNGVEFYLRHIIQKRIKFAIWTGSLDLSDEEGARKFSVFLDGMPKDFRVTYNPAQALDQHEVDLIVEDFKRKETSRFPVFAKPGNFDDILKYFKLCGLVILYLG